MSPRDRIIIGVRRLLEQQYLESMSDHAKDEYAGLSADEKRTTLKAFLQKQTSGSDEKWVKALQETPQSDSNFPPIVSSHDRLKERPHSY
jgi:hypothetical protein